MSNTLITAIVSLLYLIQFLIFFRIVMSWLPVNRGTVFMRYLFMVTEPILAPIRNLLSKTPLGNTMFDFSPLAVFLLISLIIRIIR